MKPGFGYARRNIPKVSNSTVCLVFLLLLVASYWFLAPDAIADESAKPEQVILTWTGDPAGSQTITWLTPDNEPACVQYLSSDGFTGSFAGAQAISAGCSKFDSTNQRRVFKIRQHQLPFYSEYSGIESGYKVYLPGRPGRGLERSFIFYHCCGHGKI